MRTGKLIQKKRNQNNGVERFDDYLSESGEENSLNVTDVSVVKRKRENISSFDSTEAKIMSDIVDYGAKEVDEPKTVKTLKADKHAGLVTRNSKFGRRTGKIIQKKRNLHNEVENFDDYLTESDVEKSLNAAENTTLSGRGMDTDMSTRKENSNLQPQISQETSKVSQPGGSLQASQQMPVGRLPARNGRFGRRTGKDLLAGKENKNLENFSAYFTDSSDLSLSLNPTPKSVQTKQSPDSEKNCKLNTMDVPTPKNSTVLDQQQVSRCRETVKEFDMEDPLGPAASPIKRASRFLSGITHQDKDLSSDVEGSDKKKKASCSSRKIRLSEKLDLIVKATGNPVENMNSNNSLLGDIKDKDECSGTVNTSLHEEEPEKKIREVTEPSPFTQQNISKLCQSEVLSGSACGKAAIANKSCKDYSKLAPTCSETMVVDENGTEIREENLEKTKHSISNNKTLAELNGFVRISTSRAKAVSGSKGNTSKKEDALMLETREKDGPSNVFSGYAEHKSVFLSLRSPKKISAPVVHKTKQDSSPPEIQNESISNGKSTFQKTKKSTSKRKRLKDNLSVEVEKGTLKGHLVDSAARADSNISSIYEKGLSQQEQVLENKSKNNNNVSQQVDNELDQESLKVAVQTDNEINNTELKAISHSVSAHGTMSQSNQLLETPKTGDRRKFKNVKKNIFASPIPEVVSPPKKARYEYEIEPVSDVCFPDNKQKIKPKPRELVKTSKSKSRRGRGRPSTKQKATKKGKKSNKTDKEELCINQSTELKILWKELEPCPEDVISLHEQGSHVPDTEQHNNENDNMKQEQEDNSFYPKGVIREDHDEFVEESEDLNLNKTNEEVKAGKGSKSKEPASKKCLTEKAGSSIKSGDLGKALPSEDIVTYVEPLKSFSGRRSQYKRSRSIAGKSKRSISFTTPGKQVSLDDRGETDSPVALRLIDTLPNITPKSGVSFRRSKSFLVTLEDSPATPDPYKFELERHRVPVADTTPKGSLSNRPIVLNSCLRDSSIKRPAKPGRKVRISNVVDTRAIDALETSQFGSESMSTVLPSPSAPPVHYADITTANNSQTSLLLPDLSHFIVRPRCSETSAGLRRSKRTRVKPVAGYKGEGVIYRRDSSGHGLVVDGIQPSLGEAKLLAVEEKRRTNLRKRRLKSMTVPAERPKRRLSTHAVNVPENTRDDDRIMVTNPDTEEEVLIDNVSRRNKVHWLGPDLAPVLSSDPTAVCLQLEQPSFSSGELQLRALAEKPYERATQTLVFIVLHGKLCLKINNQIFIVETSDHFFVPRNSAYSIQNLRREVAKLSFVNLQDSP